MDITLGGGVGLGKYPDLNRELTVPHTVTLPLSYNYL